MAREIVILLRNWKKGDFMLMFFFFFFVNQLGFWCMVFDNRMGWVRYVTGFSLGDLLLFHDNCFISYPASSCLISGNLFSV